ncbi:MAG: neutral/alkaline non-lysosomal ceramidase N-terminal domain-containing protein [Gemmataceae bacterium]|nr:neutral/alkaline non-lysosomal ceramidase N-terminal domain-containing protein [Gemmataceae bacterium]MCI0738150.1 neutral/alkaline non-lysosomal ceramidase N-terminal domain-containing protein [Gemmataceae bacterium]
MNRFVWLAALLFQGSTAAAFSGAPKSDTVQVGFGAADITPAVGKKPVYIAGFGKNRQATGVHDPLWARAVVLRHENTKIALVAVDLVGLFLQEVEKARAKLPGFTYVLVSSTHNHEGPDTLGLWGPSAFQSGIDPDYMKQVEKGIVDAVQSADKSAQPREARLGVAKDPDLLHDGREPIVKHDDLVALRFLDKGKTAGLVVQWNCHPETLSSKNTLLSADYVDATVKYLKEKYECPVVYLTGTVGGLMTSLHVPVKNDKGELLKDGTFEKTERFGRLVGQLADKAMDAAQPIRLTPIVVRTRPLFLPIDNKGYQLFWKLGVLERQSYVWTGDPDRAEPNKDKDFDAKRMCIRTELGYLKLGELEIAAIPGEIYPELVLGKVPDPAEKNADFPDAPVEPSIYGQLEAKHRMLIGLANDEIGYILSKRQWDEKAPYGYGRKTAPYGEINSLGPETAPLLCNAFRDLVKKK